MFFTKNIFDVFLFFAKNTFGTFVKKKRCTINANCYVIIGIRAKSFTKVNSCRPHPQCLAFYQF